MSEFDMAQAVRRRDDGMRGVSNLTAALAALSVVGTGAVVYAAANHTAATTATTVQSGTTSGTTSSTGTTTTAVPGGATGAPVATSHAS
jgi:hypothetical protein